MRWPGACRSTSTGSIRSTSSWYSRCGGGDLILPHLLYQLLVDRSGLDLVYQQLVQQVRQDEITAAALAARGTALSAAIGQYEAQMRSLPVRVLTEARFTREVTEAEETHRLLAEKLQQALVAEASVGSAIRIVDPAVVP